MGSTVSSLWRLLHRPRVYLTVEPILFLFAFASFLSYAVLQEFLLHLVCQKTPNCSSSGLGPSPNATTAFSSEEEGRCHVPGRVQQLVQEETSHWVLYINLASGVPSILVSILYGPISDLKGRRLFMVLPALGAIMNQVVVLLVVYLHHTLPLSFLLVGAFASGISGSFPVFNFAVFSYVSDVSSQTKRTLHISILESMTFLGATASLLLGGRWVNNIHFTGPLFCIIAIELVIVVCVIVALPESVPKQRCAHQQQSTPSSQGSPPYPEELSTRKPSHHVCGLLKSSCINLLAFLKLLFRSWKLVLLLGMFFVVEINFLGINDTVILFAQGDPLCWGTDIVGYFLAAKVFLNGLATLFVLPILSLVGFRDADLVVVGLVVGGAGLALMGFSSHTWMMFLVPVVAAMRGCVVPIIRSMLSKLTPVDKQGVLFSGVSVVEAGCILLASVIYNSLYPVTRTVFPGLIFFIMAAALLIPLVLILVLELNHRRVCQSSRASERDPLLGAIQ